MYRLFVGNLDFEHELANPAGWNPPVAIQRMLAERATSWIGLAEDGDGIWTPQPIPDLFWESLVECGLPRVKGVCELSSIDRHRIEVVPWGWSKSTRWLGSQTPQPAETAVQVSNSRRYSFELEQSLAVALPGAARIEQLDEVSNAIAWSASEFGEQTADHAWVIKANFGMAARERLLGRGPTLTQSQQHWLQRRLACDGVAFFEPWLPRRAEVGIQWHVPPLHGGRPKLQGITPLLSDAQGGYRGSEFSSEVTIPSEWQNAVQVCEQAAERLQQLGYFGPLGIDAGIYEDSTGVAYLRPLQDINARFTMGRLALGFCRLLRAGESGVWRHGREEESSPHEPQECLRVIDLTPPLVGDQPPLHTSRICIRGALNAAPSLTPP